MILEFLKQLFGWQWPPQPPLPVMFIPPVNTTPGILKSARRIHPLFSLNEEQRTLWFSYRMAVLHQVLTTISNSDFSQDLILRGSATMPTWIGPLARIPGDLDWVLLPPHAQLESESERIEYVKNILNLIDPAANQEGLKLRLDSIIYESIWEYDKAPGIRAFLPWVCHDSECDGALQMDFVFDEPLPTPPISATLNFEGLPSVTLLTASPEQSLAWKLQWLWTDGQAKKKDLYDATLLAESFPISLTLIRTTFLDDPLADLRLLKHFDRDSILNLYVSDWKDFRREHTQITGTEDEWKQRLASALTPLFNELDEQLKKLT